MSNSSSKRVLITRRTPSFHTKSGVMRASVDCRIRSDRPNKCGEASVYLQVIINSNRTTIPLLVRWPLDKFDKAAGVFLPRFKNDQEATDHNLQVTKEKGKINDIFMYYRHSDSELTVQQFQKEYRRYGSRTNFIKWALYDCQDRYDHLKIENQTWKNGMANLKIVQSFKQEIRFGDLNRNMLETLEGWLRLQKYANNTIGSILQTVKTYARRAAKAGISVNLEEIKDYSLPPTSGRLVYLNPEEIEKLKKYYRSDKIIAPHKLVLRQFLFSTVAGGLRFSDIQRRNWREIDDDMLVFVPWKGRKRGKVLRVPLIPEAFTYIENRTGLLFNTVTEQETNRTLKEIATKCHIRKNLTTHVARHTFATEFLRRGGHIEVLQKLLGHSKISTTLIYTHVDTARLKAQMQVMIDRPVDLPL